LLSQVLAILEKIDKKFLETDQLPDSEDAIQTLIAEQGQTLYNLIGNAKIS
jgi:hypothetical protein